MAQTREGAVKSAARHHGIAEEEHLRRIDAGLKHCFACKRWRPIEAFGKDGTRPDGRAYRCGECRRVKVRKITKGLVSAFKGKKHGEEAKAKMSAAKKGMRLRLGKKHTMESRQKMSQRMRQTAVRGPEHPFYKDGKTAERRGIRFSKEYARWRYDVYVRDKFTCQQCGDARGGNLNAHHIKAFADYPELRLEVSNGITLCEECHKRYKNKGSLS